MGVLDYISVIIVAVVAVPVLYPIAFEPYFRLNNNQSGSEECTGGEIITTEATGFSDNILHIPKYFSGSETTIVAYANAHPNVYIWVTVNPSNGDAPFTQALLNNIITMRDNDNDNIKILYYVYTDNGSRDINTIEQRIQDGYDWYAVDGIHFDEMAFSNATLWGEYDDLVDTIIGPTAISLANPGTSVSADKVGIMTSIIISESTSYPLQSTIVSRTFNHAYDVSNFGITVHDASTYEISFVANLVDDVSVWYITPDGGSNPYDTLSIYTTVLLDKFQDDWESANPDTVVETPNVCVTSPTIQSSDALTQNLFVLIPTVSLIVVIGGILIAGKGHLGGGFR